MTTTRPLTLFLALVLLALSFLAFSVPSARADPGIIRVTVNGTMFGACGDQINWSNPCSLQHALKDIAVSGDELWVAAGTYKPTTGTDRSATFKHKVGVALYGGFAGGETSRSQRSFTANVTILSGDIGVPGDASDNSYTVIGGDGEPTTTVLDGFTITGGNADGISGTPGRGGGMYNYGSDLTVSNVIFTGNRASLGGGMANDYSNPILTNVTFISNTAQFGGGMANDHSSWPTLTNVTFSSNSATNGGGMYNIFNIPTLTSVTFVNNTASNQGGGMYNNSWSSPQLTNVTFGGNSATDGAGMYNSDSDPTLTDVTFFGNSASNNGSGMYNSDSAPTIIDVTFSGNTAGAAGGGVYNNTSSPTLTNVTFSGNAASEGAGMYNSTSSWPTITSATFSGNSASSNGGGMSNYGSSKPTIRNTILWGNTPSIPQIYNSSSTSSLSYSVVQGGYVGGTNIITSDPRLGALGYWGGPTQTIPLLPGSSAIDAGDDAHCPPTDQRGFPRPVGLHCDVGAFEGPLNLANLPLIRR